MAALSKQTISPNGSTPTFVAVAASDTFPPGNNVFVYVKNAGASPDTVTIVTPGNVKGQAISDYSFSVPAGAERVAGPFSGSDVADATTGLATITHSFTTSVTIAVLELDPNIAT